ncbi:MAG: hypothetical protein RBS56_03245 [Candidatus Gracilibacteria bacterium]|jgi:hypothetical protein|nr:hypothetical protein [Candidatus Gracilibacteria bacterium]
MSLFKYTVTNKEGRRLSGTIEANSELLARKELNDMGFSILDFSEFKEDPSILKTDGHEKFEFEAIDVHSKIVKGTIPALNIDVASKRLKNEYDLTVLAIWKENANPADIEKAKQEGKIVLQNFLDEIAKKKLEESAPHTDEKEQEFVKEKVETLMKKVLILLQKYDKEFDNDIKNEINKKIDKLLRIKNSNNTDYIQSTAKELLSYIESQTKTLEEKGYHDKKIELKMETGSLLDELKKTQSPKTLSKDITSKIEKWQNKYKRKSEIQNSIFTKYLTKIFDYIGEKLKTPEEIKKINDEISAYKKQRFDLIKLIFKEPAKEYRNKILSNIKLINEKIKTAKDKRKVLKGASAPTQKQPDETTQSKTQIKENIFSEISTLSGFILSVYLSYYFLAYLIGTEKIFEIQKLKGLEINPNGIFKYMLVCFFLIHCGISLKQNYFEKNKFAGPIITTISILLILLTIFNL